MNPATKAAQAELARRELARRSLLDWCRYASPGFQRAAHIRHLADKLEAVERGEIRRLAVFMPPRHGKSETTSRLFPAWYLGRNPDKRVMVASYSAELASRDFGRAIRNYMRDCGHVFGVTLSDDSTAKNVWDLAGHSGGMVSAGVGGSLTGKGADLFIIDDPVKDSAEAHSDIYRERSWDWFRSVALTRLSPTGAVVLVMTRWHEDDLAGRVLEDSDDWDVVEFPASAEEKDVLGRKPGDPLWPERFDANALDRIREEVGSSTWAALYQQHPAPDDGEILKREWFKRYKETPPLVAVYSSWDCAFKGTDSSDFVVGQIWGIAGTDRYLLEQVRGRMDFPQTQAAIIDVADRYPNARAHLIEDKANGPAIIASLRHAVDRMIPVDPRGGKVARANAVAPIIEAGSVHLPEGSVGDSVILECQSFPHGKHDDQVDALTQALAHMKPETRAPKRIPRAVKSEIADVIAGGSL